MSGWINFDEATQDDRAAALGDDYRNILVTRGSFGPVTMVEIIVAGKKTLLVGDPQEALKAYLDAMADQNTGEH